MLMLDILANGSYVLLVYLPILIIGCFMKSTELMYFLIRDVLSETDL